MAFEVTCGECGGQLLVESGGVIVECPLCHAHLSIPELAEDEPAPPEELVAATTSEDSQIMARVADVPATPPEPASEITSTGTQILSPAPEINPAGSAEAPVAEPLSPVDAWASVTPPVMPPPTDSVSTESSSAESTPADSTPASSTAADSAPPAATGPSFDFLANTSGSAEAEPTNEAPQGFSIHVQTAPPTPAVPATPAAPPAAVTEPTAASAAIAMGAVPASAVPATPAASSAAATPPASTSKTVGSAPAAADVETVPKQHLIIVAGYASAVTLALLYLLLFGGGKSKEHYLESLPDLVPEIRKDGEVGMPRVLPDKDLAPGHELKLGESRRFGNLKVTPLKVTRSPVQFEHAFGNRRATKEPTQPVLKLWLRFENVSKNQEFPPLDRALAFRRIFDEKLRTDFALPFLGPADQRKTEDGERHFVYDMPEFSEYNMVGQNLNRWLKPGETWETFIPSPEEVASVKGEWVWRVLFRKGLNAKSGRGVTTLIDVHFNGKQVVDG